MNVSYAKALIEVFKYILHYIKNFCVKLARKYSNDLETHLSTLKIKSFEFKKFRRIAIINRGSSATVYSANYQGNMFALKNLNMNLYFHEKEFKKFVRELNSLHNASHPNIIKFYGTSRDFRNDVFVLVLQFANGGNLRDYLGKKQKDNRYEILWCDLIRIAKEITNGLKYLHSNLIIHRDLHSKNILIHNDIALIADLGISKDLNNAASSSNTQGILIYIGPERLSGERSNEKSDIYSLGVLLWELTSGIPPFCNSIRDLIEKIENNNVVEVILGTPEDYANLYKSCMSSEPEERPSLDNILSELGRLSERRSIQSIINTNINNKPKDQHQQSD